MFTALSIPGVFTFRPKRLGDTRGWFAETFSAAAMREQGVPAFVQENESLSGPRGTLRGLHFQRAPFAQAKLVRCVAGAIFDVVVDIRAGSPTFGRHLTARLDADEGLQLFVPAGFAHGFRTLTRDTLVQYKVSAPYAPEHEGGIAWDDPALAINWPVTADEASMSDRDRKHPRLADAKI